MANRRTMETGAWLNPIVQATRRARRGNTIVEYVIIGILLVVVSIAVLQMLSSGLNSAMAMIRNDMKSHRQTALAAQAAQITAGSGAPGSQFTGLSASQQATLEESLAQKLQTTGANGSTELLAQQLAAMANLLLQEGKINQNQYNILMQLSNQGHRMAQIESLISQATTMANGDYNAYSNMKFNIDGQTYTPNQLTDMLGFKGPTPYYFVNNSVLDPSVASTADPELATFLSLYNQAAASGALSDPLVKSTVDSAATQIASLGELVESVSPELQNGSVTNNQSITDLESSEASSMNSSQICTAGKFQDNGALCTP